MVDVSPSPERLHLIRTILKAQSRWPAGTPGGKGGQFAPSRTGGGFRRPQRRGVWPAVHPKVDDDGNPVVIHNPTKPSRASTWFRRDKTATFTPGGRVPGKLNGVAFSKWTEAPATKEEWATVEGQRPILDELIPFTPTPGKSVGAGVIIREPDGRIWLTTPSNSFGGYQNTYPKGTVEPGLSLQASAIKEAYEETGLKVRIVGVVGDFERTTSKARFYLAERVGGTPADMGWESQAVRLAPTKDLPRFLNMPVDRKIAEHLKDVGIIKSRAAFLAAVAKAKTPPKGGKNGSYNPNQPRWPAGTPLGGQWMAYDAAGLIKPPTIAAGLGGKNPSYQKKADTMYALVKAGKLAEALELGASLKAKAKANAAAGKKSSHVKWTAQAAQYAELVFKQAMGKAPLGGAAAKEAKDAKDAKGGASGGPVKLSAMKKVGAKPGGSNPGAIYDKDGTKVLVKGNAKFASGAVTAKQNDDRAKNEVLAAKLMQAAGVGAPNMGLVDLEGEHGGGLGVYSEMVDGTTSFNPGNKAHLEAARADFAVHAWLANYDVLGMGYDNLVIKDGKAINIDPGGALLFRAQGLPKDGGLSPDAPEFESMRTTSVEQAKVFGTMSKSALQKSAAKLALISDDQIKTLVEAHGPGDAAERKKLADVLIARRDAIIKKAGVKVTQKDGMPAADPVPPKAPPKLAEAVKAKPSATPAPPKFDTGFPVVDKKYAAVAQKLAEMHKNGDLAGLKTVKGKKGFVGYLHTGSTAGDQLTEYHKKLVADLEGAQAKAAKQVADGAATVTGKDGAKWKAKDGVLTPEEGGAKAKPISADAQKAVETALFGASGASVFSGAEKAAYKAMTEAAAKGDIDAMVAVEASGKLLALKAGLAALAQNDHSPEVAASIASGLMPKAPAAPQKVKVLDGPEVSALVEPVYGDKFYNLPLGLANTISSMAKHAYKGDLAGLEAHEAHTEKEKAFKAALIAAMTGKKMPASVRVKNTQEPKGKASTGAAPAIDISAFEQAKLPSTNTNAKSHNKKVDAIKAAFEAGDAKAILAMNFGSNNYAAKQVKLANDALAALGAPHQVSKSQKKNSHPALVGGSAQLGTGVKAKSYAGTGASAGTKPGREGPIPPEKMPKMPDVMNWFGSGKPYSSKEWKNKANIEALQAIHDAAISGGIEAVEALRFPVLDPDTGKPTGKKVSAKDHPAKKLVTAYVSEVIDAVSDWKNPPKPVGNFNTVSAKSIDAATKAFKSVPLFTSVDKVSADHKFGFWVALGKVTNPAPFKPKKVQNLSTAKVAAGKKAYQDYSIATKEWVSHIQASSAMNNAYRAGKTTFQGKSLKTLTKAVYKDATPLQEGDTLYRYQTMPAGMLKQLETAKPGVVFQATGPMCTSYHPTATSHFGGHKMVIRAAKGAKAIHSHGSGSFASEKEVSTLPGQRFVLLGKSKDAKGNWTLEVLMLPPDDGFPDSYGK